MTCAPRPPPPPPPAPVSVPTSRPFSVTIRLKTSPTERTPAPGFQSYFPAMTRARPANLSDSVPASLDRAACVVCARSGAEVSTAAIATTHAIVLVRIVLIDISCFFLGLFRLLCGPCDSGVPQKHKLLALYDGGLKIPQLHYYHDDIDVSARFCYSLGEGFKSFSGGSR